MEDKNTPTTQQPSLLNEVSTARTKARDMLRMIKINEHLSYILVLENKIKEYEKEIQLDEKYLAIEKYDLSKLDTEHPDYEDRKKNLESRIKNSEKDLELQKLLRNQQIQDKKEMIEKEREQIAKWESGENKVSKESLTQLAEDLILNR